MKKNDEENINRKKEKKLSKYFDALINNKKFKILNCLIKDYGTPFDSGKVIILISKLKFDRIEQEEKENNVIIEITTEKKRIVVRGKWKYAWNSAGNYGVAFLIKDFIKDN